MRVVKGGRRGMDELIIALIICLFAPVVIELKLMLMRVLTEDSIE